MEEAIPNKSSFTRARRRLGPGPLEAVFRRLAGPSAPDSLEAAFWRGMRTAAVDGFVLDVPDTRRTAPRSEGRRTPRDSRQGSPRPGWRR
jgi:hypothetical protein